jgi:undecaprenyl-diphosphatase
LKYWLFIWAVLVSYSRIYNGVHYPGDVIVAAIIGVLIGWGVSKIWDYYQVKLESKSSDYDKQNQDKCFIIGSVFGSSRN